MPSTQSYNPIVIGFVEGRGSVHLPLQAARSAYGELPSDYGLLLGEGRRASKALNLPVGLAVVDLLRKGRQLPDMLAKFYARWGRDYQADFRVRMERLHSLNDAWTVRQVLDANREVLAECLDLDVPAYLQTEQLIPKAVLRSIPADRLVYKALEILARKQRNPAHRGELEPLTNARALLSAHQAAGNLAVLLGEGSSRSDADRIGVHADEIAAELYALSAFVALDGVDRLACVRGKGVEVALAPRTPGFLALGKEVGDCTADKLFRQVDRDVENIYWTVFAWFLDRQYQILRVFFDGQFVMKVHLVPLLAVEGSGGELFLAVDAVETTPVFREDTPVGRPDLLDKKEYIFARMVDAVREIARTMGITHVFAERFSNTAWVRRELEEYPEVYLHIGSIQKVDELEDVFELAKRVCAAAGREHPTSLFMELQVKNTFLMPGTATVRGVKVFSALAGDGRAGLSMRRVFGV
jgi:hypothetical protein